VVCTPSRCKPFPEVERSSGAIGQAGLFIREGRKQKVQRIPHTRTHPLNSRPAWKSFWSIEGTFYQDCFCESASGRGESLEPAVRVERYARRMKWQQVSPSEAFQFAQVFSRSCLSYFFHWFQQISITTRKNGCHNRNRPAWKTSRKGSV